MEYACGINNDWFYKDGDCMVNGWSFVNDQFYVECYLIKMGYKVEGLTIHNIPQSLMGITGTDHVRYTFTARTKKKYLPVEKVLLFVLTFMTIFTTFMCIMIGGKEYMSCSVLVGMNGLVAIITLVKIIYGKKVWL